jgi:hypothetical protein
MDSYTVDYAPLSTDFGIITYISARNIFEYIQFHKTTTQYIFRGPKSSVKSTGMKKRDAISDDTDQKALLAVSFDSPYRNVSKFWSSRLLQECKV